MKVVVAFDSFKGSLDSRSAGDAARLGVLAAAPDAEVAVREIADGGEGTLSAVLRACGGHEVSVETVDARGRPMVAGYGVVPEHGRRMAVVEAARVIGLAAAEPVDATLPVQASSYGLGVVLRHALASGVDRVVVALGGSATTDGGTGALAALGQPVVDDRGGGVGPGTNPLWHGASLRPQSVTDVGVDLTLLTDVRAPMSGPDGAAHVFGPQKGATPEQVRVLDEHLVRWAAALEAASGRAVADVPGAGAAGGIAGGLLALGASIEPGFDFVARQIGLARALEGADLVLTGEGSLDAQTTMGKAPAGVARMAQEAGAVVVALGGRVDRPLRGAGFDATLPIHSRVRPLLEALDPGVTRAEVEASAEELTRLFVAARRTATTPAR